MAARQAQALYDFDAQSPEELPLAEGEILSIINEDVGGGWWEARNQYGRTGLIPKDYVDLLPEDSLPEPSMPPPPLPVSAPSSWDNQQQSYQQSNSDWNQQPSAPPAVGDDDDWDDDEWSDDDGSSVTTQQNHNDHSQIRRDQTANRNRDSAKTKTVRMSTNNKLGFDSQLFSREAQNVPNDDLIKIVETRRGWEWEPVTDPYTCLVDSPKKSSKLKGLKSFIVYQLTPSYSGIAVQRRYKHFDWLHHQFVEKFPTVVIPPLPDKQISGRYEEDFIHDRMKQLQEWVTRIMNHPVVSRTKVWRHFLSCTNEKDWKKGKRDAENDKFKGGRFFATIVTPAVPLDLSKVEKDVENFGGFARKMDDSVRLFSNVVADQIKRYPHNFRKEYHKVSEAISSVKDAFDSDGCNESQQLNSALADTSKAYADIATMFHQQPRKDWLPLADTLHVYKGILSGFDNTLGAQKIASAKVRESQKLQEEGKLAEGDVQAISSHADAISYSLYAEINHFQANRQQEFKLMMQHFLSEQIQFYKDITERLEKAKSHYDSF